MRPTSAVTIHDAVSPLEVNAFGGLISEYVAWCRERYKNDPWLIEMAFSYQGLDEELLKLTELYGPPNGRMLIAEDAYEVLGGVAYKRVDARTCEMKRMFVRTTANGRGLGRMLCKAIMQAAAKDGFDVMRLDTSREMVEAIGLYKSFGFKEVAPFIEYPERMRPMMIFMERSLSDIG
ncbi:GNAT family N-acetyltransferase [Hyphomonas sp.]|uniref:GNAT family N-acetyltransferase n=1 Tax=Hyphomonas sp. TaxID=87 RepID=UPI0025BE2DE3|nr:GNAT family N-acetyltransferase [Hyphomonas sp.]MBI1399303.1 GNAT family N-acetyltransferase [Hyphomonas sp.]